MVLAVPLREENRAMASYWLGDAQLDRMVRRTLRCLVSADLSNIRAGVCQKLREEGVVKSFQFLPDENDTWCALQRLVKNGYVDKYVQEHTTGEHIRYRINVRK